MSWKVITEPAEEPISLAEAKLNLRIDDDLDHEDDVVEGLIVAARRYCEKHTGRQFVTAGLRLALDKFPARERGLIELPSPPLIGSVVVKYYDADNVLTTLAADAYDVDTIGEPGRIRPVTGTNWPTVRDRLNAVLIEYSAGYGSAADVPFTIKRAMHLLVGHWFKNREALGNVGGEVALAVRSLLGVEWDGTYRYAGHGGER